MEDKIIASYLDENGNVEHYLRHENLEEEASWSSGEGLTLSGDDWEQFYPSSRILEITRFTDSDPFISKAIEHDQILQRFYSGKTSELVEIAGDIKDKLYPRPKMTYVELKNWIRENYAGFRNEAAVDSLISVIYSAGVLSDDFEVEKFFSRSSSHINA